jgi:hypothetical protein
VANSRCNSDRIGGAALNRPGRRLGGDNLARENCGKPTDDFERQLRVLTYANYFRSWPSKADIVSAGWQVSKVSMPEVAGLRGDQAPTPLSTEKGVARAPIVNQYEWLFRHLEGILTRFGT